MSLMLYLVIEQDITPEIFELNRLTGRFKVNSIINNTKMQRSEDSLFTDVIWIVSYYSIHCCDG